MSRAHRAWVLPASLLLAIVLGLLPLPQVLQPLRPYWLALVLAYWVLEAPEHAGLGLAFIAGLLADRAVAPDRLLHRVGAVPRQRMADIDVALRRHLAL